MSSSEAQPPSDESVVPASRRSAPSKSRNVGRWGALVVALAAAYVLSVVIRGSSDRDQGERHPAVGHPFVFLSLRSIDDGSYENLSNLAGDVVLLNFWGTWCPPCREELPRLAALAEKYVDQADFRLLAIACPQSPDESVEEVAAEARRYLRENKLRLPAYVDVEFQTQQAASLTVGAEGFPTTIMLDRNGRVRGVWIGYERGFEQQMNELAARLLAEAAKPEMPELTITGREEIVPIEGEEPPP